MKIKRISLGLLLLISTLCSAQNWSALTTKYTFYNNNFERKSAVPAAPQTVTLANDGSLFVSTINSQPFALGGSAKLPINNFSVGLKELGFDPKDGLKFLYDASGILYAHNHIFFAYKKADGNKWQGFNLGTKANIKPSGTIPVLECSQITGSVIDKNGDIIILGIKDNVPVFATLKNNNWSYKAPEDFIKSIQQKYAVKPAKGFSIAFNTGSGDALRISSEGFDIVPAIGTEIPYPAEFLFYNLTIDKNGDLWLLSNQNLYRRTNGQLQKISDKTVNFLSASKTGDIYLSTESGIEKVSSSRVFELITSKLATYFYVDGNDVLWFVPKVKVENPSEKRMIDLSDGFKAGIKSAIDEVKKENEQKPYEADNLIRYDIKNKLTFVLSPQNSPLSETPITQITADDNGNKYIVNANGIYILREPVVDEKYQSLWSTIYPYQKKKADYTDNQWCTAYEISNTEGLVAAKNKLGFIKNGQVEYKDIKLPDVTKMSNQFYNYFSCVVADKNGNIYLGTHLKGIYKYGENSCTSLEIDEKITGKEINSLAIDQNNNLWIGADKALAKYDGKTFTYYTKKNSELINSEINTLYVDNDNVLWIGTDGGGLFAFDGNIWKSFTKKLNGLKSDKVEALTGYGKTIYFVASGELHTLENGTVKVEDSSKEKALSHIQDKGLFASPDGNLWIVTRGISIFCKQPDGTYIKYDRNNSPLPENSAISEMVFINGEIRLHLQQAGLFNNTAIGMGGVANASPKDDINSKHSERFYSFEDEVILSLKIK